MKFTNSIIYTPVQYLASFVCLISFFLQYISWQNDHLQKDWVQVDASVVKIEKVKRYSKTYDLKGNLQDQREYLLSKVDIEYEVNGKLYKNTVKQENFPETSTSTRIFIDPKNPSKFSQKKRKIKEHYHGLWLMPLLSLLLALTAIRNTRKFFSLFRSITGLFSKHTNSKREESLNNERSKDNAA
jgi:flagellar basal body-associated protein FliL